MRWRQINNLAQNQNEHRNTEKLIAYALHTFAYRKPFLIESRASFQGAHGCRSVRQRQIALVSRIKSNRGTTRIGKGNRGLSPLFARCFGKRALPAVTPNRIKYAR